MDKKTKRLMLLLCVVCILVIAGWIRSEHVHRADKAALDKAMALYDSLKNEHDGDTARTTVEEIAAILNRRGYDLDSIHTTTRELNRRVEIIYEQEGLDSVKEMEKLSNARLGDFAAAEELEAKFFYCMGNAGADTKFASLGEYVRKLVVATYLTAAQQNAARRGVKIGFDDLKKSGIVVPAVYRPAENPTKVAKTKKKGVR